MPLTHITRKNLRQEKEGLGDAMKNDLILGCIADDFTGASDAASFLVKGGLRTILYNEVPGEDVCVPQDCEAVVIALKTRTQETAAAVDISIQALRWLIAQGAKHFYVKYCSTFDSTPKGNIGPIVDAAMAELNVDMTLLCPALPANGRTVEMGKLLVHGVPLDQSPMKDHPLTPMWDCRISELMRQQGQYRCLCLDARALQCRETVLALIGAKKKHCSRFYVVPDYICDEDGQHIAELFGAERLLTGGSGLLEHWARFLKSGKKEARNGGQLLLAGSCSSATLSQIAKFQAAGRPSLRVEPEELLSGVVTVTSLWARVAQYQEPVLVYSSDVPENVKKNQHRGAAAVSAVLENTMAALAQRAANADFDAIIVAGGETSGAVVRKLGYSAYRIGESVAPGVPIMAPVEKPSLRLILKSGNFGDENFFAKALDMLNQKENVLRAQKETAVRICRDLFLRGKATGSTSNISFRLDDRVYISGSGTSFGIITPEQFACMTIDGTLIGEGTPSKEFPLHLAVYRKDPNVRAVLHTHSTYSTLWSCLHHNNVKDCVPSYTPYLRMKVGKIGLIPYGPPGSEALFALFEENMQQSDGWLLANHGPVVGGTSLDDAFYKLEELEESCKIAWELRQESGMSLLENGQLCCPEKR